MKKERNCVKDNNEDMKEEAKKERKRNKRNERKPLELSPIAKPLPACLQLLLKTALRHQHILMPLTSLDPDLSTYSWINLPYSL